MGLETAKYQVSRTLVHAGFKSRRARANLVPLFRPAFIIG
jgi:hypothetical protein